MKIAIIGAGNMGGSIARGLAKGSLIDDSDIIVSNPSAGKLEKLKKEFRVSLSPTAMWKLPQEQILSSLLSNRGLWNR